MPVAGAAVFDKCLKDFRCFAGVSSEFSKKKLLSEISVLGAKALPSNK